MLIFLSKGPPRPIGAHGFVEDFAFFTIQKGQMCSNKKDQILTVGVW